MDDIQNVKIRFVTDTTDLQGARAAIQGLGQEEKKLAEEFNAVNKAAQTQGATFQKVKQEADSMGKTVEDANKKSQKSFFDLNNVAKTVGGAIAGYFAVSTLVSFGKEVLEITSKFEKFEAVLTNTLGSKSEAQKALRDIQTFAARTPFSVAELTESFVKLANQGFKPTADEMRKLGDLSASTGKSFDMLTEAIIDAQTGEFERLKEFGIRASKEGDQVKFTFKGVETQTQFTASAIRDYVLSLGDAVGVSGSMAAISETVGGKVSNMGDAFDSLFFTLGSANSGIFKDTISAITSLVHGLEVALLTQEQLQSKLDGMVTDTRVNQYFGFLEEDIKKLQAVSTADEARRLVYATQISEQRKELDASIKQLENQRKIFGDGLLSDQQKTILKELEGEVQYYETTLKRLVESKDAIDKNESDRMKAEDAAKKKNESEEEKRRKEREKKQKEAFREEIEVAKSQTKELENIEKERYLNGETDKKEYQDTIFKIDLEGFEALIPIYNKFGVDTVDIERQILDLRIKNKEEAIEKEKKLQDKANKDREESAKKLEKELAKAAKEAEDKREKEKKEAEDRRQQIEERSVQLITDIGNGLFQLESQRRNATISDIEAKRQRELQLAGDNRQAQANINKKFDDQERAIKRKQAESDKVQALFNIGISTAVAAVKQVAAVPLPAGGGLLALILALGAAQAAFVAARPIPRFNKGTKSVPGVDYGGDSITAMLRPGEGVMPVDRMNEYRPAFDAIFDRKVPASLINYIAMDYDRLGRMIPSNSENSNTSKLESELKSMNKKLDRLKVLEVNMDAKGFKAYLKSDQSKTEIENNYTRIK